MIHLFKELLPKYVIEMMTVIIILAQMNAVFNEAPNLFLNSIILVFVFFIGAVITRKARSYILYFLIPVIFVLFLIIGNNLLVAILYSVLSVFRFDRLYMDRTTDRQQEAIGISLIVVILSQFIRTGILSADNYYFYAWMFIAQLILYFMLKIVEQMTDSTVKFSDYLKTIIPVGLILIIGGGVVGVLIKGITGLLKLALIGVLNGIFFLMKPLFLWMENLDFVTPEISEEERTEEGLDETVLDLINMKEQESLMENLPLDMIVIGFIVVAVIITVIILVMRSKNEEVYDKDKPEVKVVPAITDKIRQRIRLVKPDDPIREVYFDFERWTKKMGVGRFSDETIEEWIEREGFTDIFSAEELEIYSKVRYGSHSYTDVSAFKAHINTVKDKIKEKLREKKEE